MNVILQVFTHTVPLHVDIRDCRHDRCNDDRGFCVLWAFRGHFAEALNPPRNAVIPEYIFDNLLEFSQSFTKGRQEDAHEFLQYALEKLQSRNLLAKSIIDRLFQSDLVSTIQGCCLYFSESTYPMTSLSLEIEGMSDIKEALSSFFKDDKVDVKCSLCNKDVRMDKKLTLNRPPIIAALHLKRFTNDNKKITSTVEFSLDLDFQPYSPDRVPLQYYLYAMVEHKGYLAGSGHYVCYLRSAPEKWHLINDTEVTLVSEKYVLNQSPYILFYARKGTPWFSSIMEKDPRANTISE